MQPVQLGGIVFVFFLHKTTDLNHYFYFTVFMCAVEEKEMEAKQVSAVLGGKWQTPKPVKTHKGVVLKRERGIKGVCRKKKKNKIKETKSRAVTNKKVHARAV